MSAQQALEKLEGYAAELDKRSGELADTQRALDLLTPEYDDFIRDFEVDLYEASLKNGTKLPSADMRVKLAQRAMPSDFLKNYEALLRKRDRLSKRISDVKASASSQQSVLSALKVEMEATR